MPPAVVPALKPVGLAYALQEAWHNAKKPPWETPDVSKGRGKRSTAAPRRASHNERSEPFDSYSEPWMATHHRHTLYDVDGVGVTAIAFNQAGTLLALGVAHGKIRLIGMKTVCCYATIDSTEALKEAPSSTKLSGGLPPPTAVELLEFFDGDRKLAFLYNSHLFVYHLTHIEGISLLCAVDLEVVKQYIISKQIKKYTRDKSGPEGLASESFDGDVSAAEKSDNAAKTKVSETTVPKQHEIAEEKNEELIPPFAENRRHRTHTLNASKAPLGTKLNGVTFCKVLALKVSNRRLTIQQPSFPFSEAPSCLEEYLDFLILFSAPESSLNTPVRVRWLISEGCPVSCTAVLPPPILDEVLNPSVSKTNTSTHPVMTLLRYSLGVDTFELALNTSELPSGEDAPSARSVQDCIRKHNEQIAKGALNACDSSRFSEPLWDVFSIWNVSKSNTVGQSGAEQSTSNTAIFCVVAYSARQLYVVQLFPVGRNLEDNSSTNTSASLAGQLDLKSPGLTPMQLLPNRTSSLLVCRANDRLALLRVTYSNASASLDGMEKTSSNATELPSSSSTVCASDSSVISTLNRSTIQVSLEVLYVYQEPIHRERFASVVFSESPSRGEAFLLLTQKVNPALQFFSTAVSSGVNALRVKMDVSKCRGVIQMAWNPGTFQWAILAARESCVFLFGLPPQTQNWFLMLPNFEHLERNKEIIESETEFDDLVWLEQEEQKAQDTKCPKPLSYSKRIAYEFNPDDWWFTSTTTNATPPLYPFCSPSLATTSPLAPEIDKSSEHATSLITEENKPQLACRSPSGMSALCSHYMLRHTDEEASSCFMP